MEKQSIIKFIGILLFYLLPAIIILKDIVSYIKQWHSINLTKKIITVVLVILLIGLIDFAIEGFISL